MHQVSRTVDSITLSWSQPDQPNGVILDYELQYYEKVLRDWLQDLGRGGDAKGVHRLLLLAHQRGWHWLSTFWSTVMVTAQCLGSITVLVFQEELLLLSSPLLLVSSGPIAGRAGQPAASSGFIFPFPLVGNGNCGVVT